MEWPAKAQETEFGVIRSRGKRKTASSWSRPKKRQKCSLEQNWGNLLILVFFRFQYPIPVEWPAKAQETEFGAIRSRGKRKAASSWSQQKKRKKTAKTCQSANNGVFPFPTLDSGGMACKSPRNQVWCNSVNGYAQDSVVLEPAEKPTKNRQNRANLLIMVSSRFQRSIQVEWRAKAQEIKFGAIRSRGKRRAASSWSRPKKTPKVAPGSKIGVIC